MKLPRFLNRDRLHLNFNFGAGKLLAITIFTLIGILFFLTGFFSGFPEDVLENRIRYELKKNIPISITFAHADIEFPAVLLASQVRITPEGPIETELVFDSVSFSPKLSTLIGQPAIDFEALSKEGSLSGSAGANGQLSLVIGNFSFNEPVQGFSSLRLEGTVRSARLHSYLDPEPDKASTLTLEAENLAVTGTRSAGFSMDRVDLGRLDLQLEGTGRNFTVRQATLSGGAIEAEVNGRLLLGQTVASTRLNLSAELRPTSRLDPSLRSMFDLIGSPGKDGSSRAMTIRGSLARPAIR